LKKEADIAAAQEAADIAAESGVKLVHQCHTLSLFETVDGIMETLQKIDRENFGLIYEPANLELCGQPYADCIERLAPYMFNVYLQNQKLKPNGAVTLETWCRGPSSFDIVPIHASGGVNFESVFSNLKKAGYEGTVTVHQSAGEGEDPLESTTATANYLRSLI
jgi:sugar phosphate isomerase/epimerase